MKDLTDRLYVNWNALETSEEYNIMRKYAKNSRRYSLGYSLYCFVALYLFLSMSFIPQLLDVVLPLNKSRPILLTYPGYYFVDERKYFFYIFLHAIVAWEIAMTGIVAHDCIFVTYVEHVCSMFAVIGFRLEHLFYNRNNQMKTINTNTDNAYRKRIAFIVHAHRKALKYTQLLEDTFNVPFAMQILIVTIGMSITLLQVCIHLYKMVYVCIMQKIKILYLHFFMLKMMQQNSSNILESMRYALYVIGELIHLFFLSFEGQKLIDHSLQIRDKICLYTMDSNYYGVVKKVSSLVGQWPYQNPKTKLICLSFVTLSTFSIVIPQLAKFVICNGDMQCIFQTMAAHMLTIITLVKLYTCHLNRYKIKVLIDRLFLEWDELETPEEYEIMKRYAKNGRRYSLGYSLYCFISAFLFLCMSLIPPLLDIVLPLNESRPILSVHPGYYFVDEKEYFFYIFWHAVVVWEIAVTGIVAHDCMLLTYIEHVCSIFALGGFRFERLMYKCNEYESDTITVLHSRASDTFRKRIAFSVYTHRKALK
ncbi:hypothetical protein G5I_01473 [Acromyrmex echinatior]|uniref:Odorant receptor n=1 Tax=Acromyrmex echinatior TaxID=103372 RepID=F4W7Q4_ACREC|nr:hypothetical protein G5I_01473 [Acromyrmex echinatior]